MRYFVRHHSGQLRFFIRAQNQSAVYVEKSARKGEGVNLVGVDHLDGKGTLASEFRTRFWPTRFTYSVITGSVINFEDLFDLPARPAFREPFLSQSNKN